MNEEHHEPGADDDEPADWVFDGLQGALHDFLGEAHGVVAHPSLAESLELLLRNLVSLEPRAVQLFVVEKKIQGGVQVEEPASSEQSAKHPAQASERSCDPIRSLGAWDTGGVPTQACSFLERDLVDWDHDARYDKRKDHWHHLDLMWEPCRQKCEYKQSLKGDAVIDDLNEVRLVVQRV